MTACRGRTSRKRKSRLQCVELNQQTKKLDSNDVYVNLLKWMKAKASWKTTRLIPAVFQCTGRGLLLTKCVESHQVIISLPEEFLITMETVHSSYLGCFMNGVSEMEGLCSFLICERHRGPSQSEWWPFIATLPAKYTVPLYWHDEDIQLLPSHLQQSISKQRKLVQKLYENSKGNVFRHIEEKLTELCGIFTWDSFIWAWSSVNTRSVYMNSVKSKALNKLGLSSDRNYALAPFLDLLNHSSNIEVHAGFNEKTRCYEVATITPQKRFHQAFISYGPHDNEKLLVEYGFTLSRNKVNSVSVSLDDLKALCQHFNICEFNQRLHFMQQHNLNIGLQCTLFGISWNLLTALKILALNPEQFHYLRSSGHIEILDVYCNDAEVRPLAEHLIRKSLSDLHIPDILCVHAQPRHQLRRDQGGCILQNLQGAREMEHSPSPAPKDVDIVVCLICRPIVAYILNQGINSHHKENVTNDFAKVMIKQVWADIQSILEYCLHEVSNLNVVD